jgi:hypothetical protein
MKKTLLLLTLTASLFGFTAKAQTTLQVYNDAVFYSMYEGTVQNQPVPEGAQRNSNTSYGKKLTESQIASFGNTLTLNVSAASLCDNYDRIGNINLAFVPKNAPGYVYNQVERIEIGRFITPFMIPDGTLEVPYTYDVSNILHILRDPELSALYDFWVELEIAGYQGGPGQGGAAEEYPSICAGRNDVYRGSLEFVTSGTYQAVPTYFEKLSYKYELKNYTLDGTDVLGQTVKTITFTVDEPVYDAKFYFINSNHGSNTNGEEYVRRNHYIYLDGVQKLLYKPGGVSCVPYRPYNTQGNCIYIDCSINQWRPNTNAAWSWNNWCPGDKVPIRVIELGDLAPGEHSFKIEVPAAQFAGGQGYFPMSVYVQGTTEDLTGIEDFAANKFTVTPNPVNDVATINVIGHDIKAVSVTNTLGQVVLTGASEKLDLSSLQAGIYMVKVDFANNTSAVQKIIKK